MESNKTVKNSPSCKAYRCSYLKFFG